MFSKKNAKLLTLLAMPGVVFSSANCFAQDKQAERTLPVADVQLGERQGRLEKTEQVKALARINMRIQNRIDNRLDRSKMLKDDPVDTLERTQIEPRVNTRLGPR